MGENIDKQLKNYIFNPLYEALTHLKTHNKDKITLAKGCVDTAEKNAEEYRGRLEEIEYDVNIQGQIDVVKLLLGYSGKRVDELDSTYESLLELRYFKKYQIPKILDGLGNAISEIICPSSELISKEALEGDAYREIIDQKINSVLGKRAIAGMPFGPVFDAFNEYIDKLHESVKLFETEDLSGFKTSLVNKTKELVTILNDGVDNEIKEYLTGKR